jgi:hypothetical protein
MITPLVETMPFLPEPFRGVRSYTCRSPKSEPNADPSRGLVVKPEEDEMRSALTWFVILAGVCIAGPYVLGVPPRTRRDRFYLGLTLAFLAWILGLMISVRSR